MIGRLFGLSCFSNTLRLFPPPVKPGGVAAGLGFSERQSVLDGIVAEIIIVIRVESLTRLRGSGSL